MATRSITKFGRKTEGEFDVQAAVYKHYDGYPEAMRATFAQFFAAVMADTADTRFSDPTYLGAKFVVFLAGVYAKSPAGNVAKYEEFSQINGRPVVARPSLDFLGVGVVAPNADVGQEYEYFVDSANVGGYPDVLYRHVFRGDTWERLVIPASLVDSITGPAASQPGILHIDGHVVGPDSPAYADLLAGGSGADR